MRERIWSNLANTKFKSLYVAECSLLAGSWGRAYSFVLAFASASSVATWAIWQQWPVLWALIVAVAQVLQIAKPYLPFLRSETGLLQMSFEFEKLYLEYERLWYCEEEERIAPQACEAEFYALRQKEVDILQRQGAVRCPRKGRLIEEAQARTEEALCVYFP